MTRCFRQGGTVVNADQHFKADVLIKDGKIDSVGTSLKVWPQDRYPKIFRYAMICTQTLCILL